MRLCFSALVLLLVACDTPTVPHTTVTSGFAAVREGTTKSNYWITDYTLTGWNSCTNEEMLITGKAHLIETYIIDGETTTYKLHDNELFKGVGLKTGYEYLSTAHQQLVEIDQAGPPPTWTLTSNIPWNIVGRGQAPNLRMHSIVTYTFDGAAVHADVKKFDITCSAE